MNAEIYKLFNSVQKRKSKLTRLLFFIMFLIEQKRLSEKKLILYYCLNYYSISINTFNEAIKVLKKEKIITERIDLLDTRKKFLMIV